MEYWSKNFRNTVRPELQVPEYHALLIVTCHPIFPSSRSNHVHMRILKLIRSIYRGGRREAEEGWWFTRRDQLGVESAGPISIDSFQL